MGTDHVNEPMADLYNTTFDGSQGESLIPRRSVIF